MAEPLKTIALLVANPALSALLRATLAAVRVFRVRPFATPEALATYLNLIPAQCVVVDLSGVEGDPELLAQRLRRQAGGRDLRLIALVDSPQVRTYHERASEFDEFIVKPMSPLYLVERVKAQLVGVQVRPPARLRPATDWSRFGENVVALFPREPHPPRPH